MIFEKVFRASFAAWLPTRGRAELSETKREMKEAENTFSLSVVVVVGDSQSKTLATAVSYLMFVCVSGRVSLVNVRKIFVRVFYFFMCVHFYTRSVV